MEKSRKPWYRRKRVLIPAAVAGVAVLGVLVMARDLRPVMGFAGRLAGAEVTADEARFGWRRLVTRNLTVRQPGKDEFFVRVDAINVRWHWTELLRGRVEVADIQGPRLSLQRLQDFQESLAKKDHAGAPVKKEAAQSGLSLLLKALIVRDGTLILDNLGVGMPAVPIDVATIDPIVVKNLRLGGGGNDAGANEEQTITMLNLTIHSPYDPLTNVIRFEEISLTFSWAGIQRQELKELLIKNPTVFIGPDLFFFADQLQTARAAVAAQAAGKPAAEASEPGEPWKIGHFHLWGGRLVVQSFGKPGFPLPMIFMAETDNLVLQNFAELPFNRLGFDIPPTDLEYPTLGLQVINLQGSLFVGLPLTDAGAKNLVPVLSIDELEWKGLRMRNLFMSLTFDRTNIHAEFGGETEKWSALNKNAEYLNGGFDIDLTDFSWTGWGAASQVNVYRVTRLLSPDNFLMNGQASGEFIVHGQVSEVQGIGGNLKLDDRGKIQIVAVDELINNLPGEWWQPKRAAVRTLLEAFRDYDYDAGGGIEFTFAPPESFFRLSVDGKQGKRNFDLRWHDRRAKPSLKF